MHDRNKFIGGSDIAVVMGLSRWKTPLQLWAEKTGKAQPSDLSEVEAVQLGTELEDFVAKKFERETGMKVRRSPKRYVSKTHKFLACQVDRLIKGADELLECKTCSAWKAKEWENEEIPIEYILQVMFQLGITGRKIGHIAVLIGGQSFRYKQIKFDATMFDKMESEAIKFWGLVESNTPPMAVGADNDFMVELNPTAGSEIKEATQEINDAVAMLQQTKAQIIELEKTKDEIEAKLKEVIGANAGIKTPEYTVKWLNVKGSTFTVTKKDSRMLRVSKNKEQI